MNNKGWIRIIEAFIAILLITTVALIVINKGYIGRTDKSSKVYDAQIAALREIELDQELRDLILMSDAPVGGEDVPEEVRQRLDARLPESLQCSPRICVLDQICSLEDYPETEEVYAQAIAVTANLSEYDPKQLKIFCWIN